MKNTTTTTKKIIQRDDKMPVGMLLTRFFFFLNTRSTIHKSYIRSFEYIHISLDANIYYYI